MTLLGPLSHPQYLAGRGSRRRRGRYRAKESKGEERNGRRSRNKSISRRKIGRRSNEKEKTKQG